MSSVTFPPEYGGDGNTYTDDGNPNTGLANGGHRERFVPALENAVAMAAWTKAKADETAADRQQTGEDRVATGEDRQQTGEDRIATGEDRVQTGLDRQQTGEDRQQTEQALQQALVLYGDLDAVERARSDAESSASRSASSAQASAQSATSADAAQAGAQAARIGAEEAEAGAKAARDQAQLNSNTYLTIQDGLDNTGNDELFSVATDEVGEYLALYRNDNGSAYLIDTYPSAQALQTAQATIESAQIAQIQMAADIIRTQDIVAEHHAFA